MTVEQLIEKLKSFPPDAKVLICLENSAGMHNPHTIEFDPETNTVSMGGGLVGFLAR